MQIKANIVKYILSFFLVSPAAFGDVILCTGMSNARDVCEDWRKNNTTSHQIINGAIGGFAINTIYDLPDQYWSQVLQKVADAGLSPAEIDILWNKNATRAESGDLITERQIVHDYFIWFQTTAEAMFSNLKAGYHSPRTSGEFCDLNPEPFAGDVRNAILGAGDSSGAITHFEKWHFGPDLSVPVYVKSDFTDGCHPGKGGLAKTTPIMNDFFSNMSEPPLSINPVVTSFGSGRFNVSWENEGSLLSCSGSQFGVQGQSHEIRLPDDLPFGIRHQCSIDQSPLSNKFGCRSLSDCRAW